MCNRGAWQSWTGRRSGWTSASRSAPTPPHPAATWADPPGAPATGATGATGAAAGGTGAAGAGTDTGAEGYKAVVQVSDVLCWFSGGRRVRTTGAGLPRRGLATDTGPGLGATRHVSIDKIIYIQSTFAAAPHYLM